jgi:hypothetical protein
MIIRKYPLTTSVTIISYILYGIIKIHIKLSKSYDKNEENKIKLNSLGKNYIF